jgi:hypothetical protein
VKRLPAGQMAMVDKMVARITELKEQGLTMINLYNC